MTEIHQQKSNFGKISLGKGEPINLEYVSANPTGPLHVGHVRGAVFGDVLANLLENANYRVTREYYLNDAGQQILLLIKSLYWRYQELFGKVKPPIPEDYYPGDYLITIAKNLQQRDGEQWLNQPLDSYFAPLRCFVLDAILADIKRDLQTLGVRMDYYNSEHDLIEQGKTQKMLDRLKEQDLLYQGTLPPPKGKEMNDWKPRPQLLFRATNFGDESDRALQKEDGSLTYFANDIAGHDDKYQRGFSSMINIWGADHGGYVKRMQAAVQAISDKKAQLQVCLMQIVRLMEGGRSVKMSKRSGSFVTLHDLIERVGVDAIRFTMLTRDNHAHMDFDFEKVTAQNSENPVFYVQYAHARICSLQNLAVQQFPQEDFSSASLPQEIEKLAPLLQDEKELQLIKKCAYFPIILTHAAEKLQPHLLSYYLYELAEGFHKFWSAGNRDKNMRFILENDINLTKARLILALAVAFVLKNGLALMGVSAPEKL